MGVEWDASGQERDAAAVGQVDGSRRRASDAAAAWNTNVCGGKNGKFSMSSIVVVGLMFGFTPTERHGGWLAGAGAGSRRVGRRRRPVDAGTR